MDETRTSESGTLTYDEYKRQAIEQCPELSLLDPSSRTFSIMDCWNWGNPVGFCVYAFKKSKAYRKIAWENRKNDHGRQFDVLAITKSL